MVIDSPVRLTDEEADFVEHLIEEQKSVINNVIRTTLGKEFSHLYDDCVSEVYILMCQKVKELQTHPAPDGWVVVTSKNVSKHLKNKEMLRINKGNKIKDIKTYEGDVFEEVFYNLMVEDNTVGKIIATFSPREKEVYQMVYVRGVGFAETAERLGISASTVRNIHKSLKDKVQKYIKENLR